MECDCKATQKTGNQIGCDGWSMWSPFGINKREKKMKDGKMKCVLLYRRWFYLARVGKGGSKFHIMSALIPEALGNTHLEEAVVLHWKFAVAKKDSKPCKGVPVVKIVYIAAGPKQPQIRLWGPVVHHTLGESLWLERIHSFHEWKRTKMWGGKTAGKNFVWSTALRFQPENRTHMSRTSAALPLHFKPFKQREQYRKSHRTHEKGGCAESLLSFLCIYLLTKNIFLIEWPLRFYPMKYLV